MRSGVVHDGIAEVHVARSHVDFGTQHARTFLKLTGIHTHEQVEIFLGSTVAEGAFGTGFGGSALLCGNLL